MNKARILAASAPIAALLFTTSWHGGEAREATGERAAAAPAAALQQAPPPTVRHEAHIMVGGNKPPAGALTNPHKGSAAAEEGERIFGLFNCDACHGGGAVGFVGPALSDGRFKYGDSDGEIFQSIFYGRPLGMPAYGGTLPRDAIWRLVTYIQSLHPTEDISTVSW